MAVCYGLLPNFIPLENNDYESQLYGHASPDIAYGDGAPAGGVALRIGHAVGGVCPFAIKDDVSTWLDVSLKRFDTVFPACGSANSAIELSCAQLEAAAQGFAGWVDVCKDWREAT